MHTMPRNEYGQFQSIQRFFEKDLKLHSDWNTSEYASVNEWIQALNRRGGSVATKLGYFKGLAYFVHHAGLNPDELIHLPQQEIARNIQAFCDAYANQGKLSTAYLRMQILRSFFRCNGITGLRLHSYKRNRSLRLERVPTKDEVYRMANVSNLRDRALILCAFQSGLRNSMLRALQYHDIKHQLNHDIIPIHITPQLKERVPQAAKEDVEYWTFFSREAGDALQLYLEDRERRHGAIRSDEPLFRVESNVPEHIARTKPMSDDGLLKIVKQAAQKAGIKAWKHVRFHSLRKTFRSVLDAGYRDGGQMAEDDKEYLMGHTLPSHKAPYHNANLETLKDRYAKLQWGLSTPSSVRELDILRTLAKSIGIDPMKIRYERAKQLNREPTSQEEVDAIQTEIQQLIGASMTIQHTNNQGKPYQSTIVTENELVAFIEEGWEIIRELSSQRFLMKRPNHITR